jgi:integrase/recombinase XerC
VTQDNEGTEALLEGFKKWLVRHDRSAHSIRAYLSDVRQFMSWCGGDSEASFELALIGDEDVQSWRDQLEQKAMPATVNRKLAALSTFFGWAIEVRLVTTDPTSNINGVEQQAVAPKALTEAAMNRILRRAKESGNLRDHALLELLAATGLRASEAAGLMVGDLTLGERSGWVTVRMGKGRRRRKVPVHLRARKALNTYLEQEQLNEPSARAAHAADPLFRSRAGEPLTCYALWYTVKKYARLAEVEGVTPHTFRHTVATRLVRDPETDLVTAATFLGHSRLDTTARYSQPSEEDLTYAAERMRRHATSGGVDRDLK